MLLLLAKNLKYSTFFIQASYLIANQVVPSINEGIS